MNANREAVTTDEQTLAMIENDLMMARQNARFADILHHLDEILVLHKYTPKAAVKARCADLLSSPERIKAAA